jgi:hypothetical protein
MATAINDGTAPTRCGPERAIGQVTQAAALLRAALAGVDALEPVAAVELAPLFADAARVAEAGTLRCARKIGDHGARRFAGERNAASLLSSMSKTTLSKAKAGLEAAEKLRGAPVAERALWSGDLSLDQAAAIAPVAAQVPDAAGALVEAARRSSVKELKEVAARTLRSHRDESTVVENERRLHLRRFCRTWVEDGGAVRLEALFGPKDGARVIAALDHETLALVRQRRRAGREALPEQLRADALASLVGGRKHTGLATVEGSGDLGRAGGPGGGGGPSGPGGGGGSGGPGGGGGPGGPGGPSSAGPQVLVRVDAAALQRGSVVGDEICEIAGVGPVSVRVARELLCEGFLTLLVTDGVDVRTVTSTTRTVPGRVEKALLLRDARCVVPGCGTTERLEIDHWRTDFAWRGPTELANLCRLCPAHHAMKTRTGWRLVGGPGRWRWLRPRTVAELARSHGTSRFAGGTGQIVDRSADGEADVGPHERPSLSRQFNGANGNP